MNKTHKQPMCLNIERKEIIIEIQNVTPIVSAVEKKKTRNGHKMFCRGTNIG